MDLRADLHVFGEGSGNGFRCRVKIHSLILTVGLKLSFQSGVICVSLFFARAGKTNLANALCLSATRSVRSRGEGHRELSTGRRVGSPIESATLESAKKPVTLLSTRDFRISSVALFCFFRSVLFVAESLQTLQSTEFAPSPNPALVYSLPNYLQSDAYLSSSHNLDCNSPNCPRCATISYHRSICCSPSPCLQNFHTTHIRLRSVHMSTRKKIVAMTYAPTLVKQHNGYWQQILTPESEITDVKSHIVYLTLPYNLTTKIITTYNKKVHEKERDIAED
ncbi:hypothetical protein TNCV_791021 [Trichonephila clavipes]|nr:hypothetical protein TNCV_791021 [Trichonephila clavipes]